MTRLLGEMESGEDDVSAGQSYLLVLAVSNALDFMYLFFDGWKQIVLVMA